MEHNQHRWIAESRGNTRSRSRQSSFHPRIRRGGGMPTRLLGSFVVLALTSGTAEAQDARAVLQAAVKAMGTETVKCLTYSGNTGGYVGIVGQNYHPKEDWARVELASFSRTINFDARTMRDEQVRRQGNYPRRGGGGIPIEGDQRQITFVTANH